MISDYAMILTEPRFACVGTISCASQAMAATNPELVGGRTGWGLYSYRFASEGHVADPWQYCTSYLVSPVVDHQLSHEREE